MTIDWEKAHREMTVHAGNAALACIKLLPAELQARIRSSREPVSGFYITNSNLALLQECGLSEEEAFSVLGSLGGGELHHFDPDTTI